MRSENNNNIQPLRSVETIFSTTKSTSGVLIRGRSPVETDPAWRTRIAASVKIVHPESGDMCLGKYMNIQHFSGFSVQKIFIFSVNLERTVSTVQCLNFKLYIFITFNYLL